MVMRLDTQPYWSEAPFSNFPTLDTNVRADVVVVGGGITGLTTAFLLAEAGRAVVLLERSRCVSVDTGHTSAHLTMVTDARLHELVERFGPVHAQAVWDAGFAAIAEIERLIIENDLDAHFDWVDGFLHAAPDRQDDQHELDTLRHDASLASGFGFDAAFVESAAVVGLPGVRFGSQARFHPRAYLAALARAFAAKGGRIFEHSEACEFCNEPMTVEANGHTISCADIVIATHNPVAGLDNIVSATLSQTKLALYTSYVVAGRVPKGTIADALWWDTADPYNYLRVEPHRDFDVVIYGGEDHKTGQVEDTDACYRNLETRATKLLPPLELTHRWSGQVIETPDGLPYIGRVTDHQYSATGFAGNGMTFGTLSGIILADAITGRKNPWAELFDPGRLAIRRGLWDYVKENADYPYYLVRDHLTAPQAHALRSIRRGQGRIIERDGAKVAVSRDDRGKLIMRSATCTHMGCVVKWNPAEKTWDCPCHGSRFTPGGRVISGPAESPLGEAGD